MRWRRKLYLIVISCSSSHNMEIYALPSSTEITHCSQNVSAGENSMAILIYPPPSTHGHGGIRCRNLAIQRFVRRSSCARSEKHPISEWKWETSPLAILPATIPVFPVFTRKKSQLVFATKNSASIPNTANENSGTRLYNWKHLRLGARGNLQDLESWRKTASIRIASDKAAFASDVWKSTRGFWLETGISPQPCPR